MTRIIFLPFLIPPWAAGQVLFPNTIFIKSSVRDKVHEYFIAHELAHVDQLNELGLLRYWGKYLTLLFRHGYQEHPMEREATEKTLDRDMRARARDLMRRYDLL